MKALDECYKSNQFYPRYPGLLDQQVGYAENHGDPNNFHEIPLSRFKKVQTVTLHYAENIQLDSHLDWILSRSNVVICGKQKDVQKMKDALTRRRDELSLVDVLQLYHPSNY